MDGSWQEERTRVYAIMPAFHSKKADCQARDLQEQERVGGSARSGCPRGLEGPTRPSKELTGEAFGCLSMGSQ